MFTETSPSMLPTISHRQYANIRPVNSTQMMTARYLCSHTQWAPSVSSTVSPPHHPITFPTNCRSVMVVGHSQCGGAIACLNACTSESVEPTTPLARWLKPLINLARSLRLSTVDPEESLTVLVEANVRAQVENIAKSETITNAWQAGNDVQIHGLVFDIPSGRLRDLNISRNAKNLKYL